MNNFFSETDEQSQHYGILFANGRRWAEQRKFLAQYLASSKDKMNEIVSDEAFQLVNQVWCSATIHTRIMSYNITNMFVKIIFRFHPQWD